MLQYPFHGERTQNFTSEWQPIWSMALRGSAPGPLLWGFQPHTPTYFSLVRKVGKSTHGRRNPFDGVSPP